MYINLSPGPVDFQTGPGYLEQMVPHNSLAFKEMYRQVTSQLRQLLNFADTGALAVLPVSGTGAIEALFTHILQPGEKILILANGYFGERLAKMAKALGYAPLTLSFSWDRPIDPVEVKQKLQSGELHGFKAVAAVHLETSTGLLNDIAALGQIVQETGALFLVDAVSSAGAHPIEMQDWGIDGLVTVSYKGLLSPPALSIFALSERYCAQMRASGSYFLDLKKALNFSLQMKTTTTIPVNALAIMGGVATRILTQGRYAYGQQCREFAEKLRLALTQSGYPIYGQSGHSCTVTALCLPPVLKSINAKDELETRYGIFVGIGAEPYQDRIIRIGHYGNYGTEVLPLITESFSHLLSSAQALYSETQHQAVLPALSSKEVM